MDAFTKELFKRDYEEFISFDLYNMLLNSKKHPDYNIIAEVLKDRKKRDFLYSLLINK